MTTTTHFYRERKMRLIDSHYKALCIQKYAPKTETEKFTSVWARVTCKTCLQLLIPKAEKQLETMKRNLIATLF